MTTPYNNLTSTDPITKKKPEPGLVMRTLRDPKGSIGQRTMTIWLRLLITCVVLTAAAQLVTEEVLQAGIVITTLIVVVLWGITRTLKSMEEPYFARQIGIGVGVAMGWALLTMILSSWLAVPVLAMGNVLLLVLAVVLPFVPMWVMPILPGEVYNQIRKLGLGQLHECKLDNTDPENTFAWIAAVDAFILFWRLGEIIEIDMMIPQVITREGYRFTLEVHFDAKFDPDNAPAGFRESLLASGGQEGVKETLKAKLEAALILISREFYITEAHHEALAAVTVIKFRDALPDLMRERVGEVGLSVDTPSVNCIPYGSEEALKAANRAAAAPFNTTADLSVQRELLDQVQREDLSAQLVLYAQMVARGGNDINYLPSLNFPAEYITDLKSGRLNPKLFADRVLQSMNENPEYAQELLAQFFMTQAEDVIVQDVNRMPPKASPSPPAGTPNDPPARGRGPTLNLGDFED